VIISFRNRGTADIFFQRDSRQARSICPEQIWEVAVRKLLVLAAASNLAELARPRGNRIHALKGDRAGQFAIRINDQYRVCFWWTKDGARDVEITDYH
jgi:proteic killer suppression protein